MSRKINILASIGCASVLVASGVLAVLFVLTMVRMQKLDQSMDLPFLFEDHRPHDSVPSATRIAQTVLGEDLMKRTDVGNARQLVLRFYYNREPGEALPVMDLGPNALLYSWVIWTPVAWRDGCRDTYSYAIYCLWNSPSKQPPDALAVPLDDGKRVWNVTLQGEPPELASGSNVRWYSNHWERHGPHFTPTGPSILGVGTPSQWTWLTLVGTPGGQDRGVLGAILQPTPDELVCFPKRAAGQRDVIIAGWCRLHRPGSRINLVVIHTDGTHQRLELHRGDKEIPGWHLVWTEPTEHGRRVALVSR